MTTPGDVIVLASGGLDSTAVIGFFREQGATIRPLFIDFGQAAATREWAAVQAVTAIYGIPVRRLDIGALQPSLTSSAPGRNGLFLHLALLASAPFAGLIALGIHAGTAYPDCSTDFLNLMRGAFELYSAGSVEVVAPFVSWSKADIWRFACDHGLPVDATYSCELGLDQPCARCLSCRERIELDARS